jgi:transcriptional regulator with XRE-family HTH domain
MSQERLADLTGVGRLRVADWEAGRITPGAGATERIGAALDVPWWALYVPPPVELISPGAPAEQAPRPAQKHPAPL